MSILLFGGLVIACSGDGGSPAAPSAVLSNGTAADTAAGDGTSVAAAQALVEVCHVRGDGSFELLEIDASAEQAHLDHGDGVPLGPVPGDAAGTLMFDDQCRIVGPAVDIEKSTNGEDADTGSGPTIPVSGAVSWLYVVVNTGDLPLSNVTVVDDDPAIGLVCQVASLAVGASHTCQEQGIAAAGPYTNLATVTADASVDGVTVSVEDSDRSHYVGEADEPDEPDDPEDGGSIKVDLCHKTGKAYRLLSVDKHAEPAHLRHGDGYPGGAVPSGGPAGTFNLDCSIS